MSVFAAIIQGNTDFGRIEGTMVCLHRCVSVMVVLFVQLATTGIISVFVEML